MIDIHCHILPCLDDGAKHMEESIQMAKLAYQQGIKTLIATPHHRTHRFDNEKETVSQAVEQLNQRLMKEQIPLTVYSGQEIRIHTEMVHDFDEHELLTLSGSRYVLIEFPFDHIPSYVEHLLYNLQSQGFVPIIAHPERYDYFVKDPGLLYDYVIDGALTQVTAGSLTGAFGKKTKKTAERMIEHNLVQFIATDAHHASGRTFDLAEGYRALRKFAGKETVRQFKTHAEQILRDEPIVYAEPKKLKATRLFGLF